MKTRPAEVAMVALSNVQVIAIEAGLGEIAEELEQIDQQIPG